MCVSASLYYIFVKVTNAVTLANLESATVKITISSGTMLDGMTDANGLVQLSPSVMDGDLITIEVMASGFDDFSQVVTVTNMETYNIALNPTVSNSLFRNTKRFMNYTQ